MKKPLNNDYISLILSILFIVTIISVLLGISIGITALLVYVGSLIFGYQISLKLILLVWVSLILIKLIIRDSK